MSTLLQLLVNYYESVIECERVYYEHVGCSKGQQESTQRDSLLVKETISLQRQIAQLTAESNQQKRENERLKQVHKTQLALLESKLENARKHPKPKTPDGATRRDKDPKSVHLLSPISKKKSEVGESSNGIAGAHGTPSAGQSNGLRQAIYKNKPTLFDEDASEAAENSNEISFLTSIKGKDKLANIVLPKDTLDSSSDLEEESNDDANAAKKSPEPEQKQKKRRLTKKRIQRVDSDGENHLLSTQGEQ
ncbi:LAQU0S10e00760g1_1 [Lachancea quebecensis]|uniref:LAQU0S10e00760g1_1 n=1 Tax=Lachancea quebecensis TaxID=1654605 RepID=A0A0P1KU82_9SACH|nr:LAQU0S10e00760g1_1 [Lachancea quebecensis]